MKRKILSTADGHIERLNKDHFTDYIQYMKSSIETYQPELFIYAGDGCDSRNVRAESEEYKMITQYFINLDKICFNNNVECIYLRGTPSHDGDVIKRIIEINNLNIRYIEDPKLIYFRGLSILLLPEIYTPTLESFNKIIRATLGKLDKADICVFHGMFDFAIPQLKQVDSSFNQSRSVVINTQHFMTNFVKTLAFGGHVHKAIKDPSYNCFYLGRFINEAHQPSSSDMFGFKYIEINDEKFSIKNVNNPYLLDYKFVDIKIHKDTTMDSILERCRHIKEDLKEVVFNVYIDKNNESRQTFKTWRKIIQPVHVKKRFIAESMDQLIDENISKVSNIVIDANDLRAMTKLFYEEATNQELSVDILDLVFGKEV